MSVILFSFLSPLLWCCRFRRLCMFWCVWCILCSVHFASFYYWKRISPLLSVLTLLSFPLARAPRPAMMSVCLVHPEGCDYCAWLAPLSLFPSYFLLSCAVTRCHPIRSRFPYVKSFGRRNRIQPVLADETTGRCPPEPVCWKERICRLARSSLAPAALR